MENVQKFDFQKLVSLKEKSKTVYTRTDKSGSYFVYNLECSFDIETTSIYIQDEKVAFMYIWMFGIGDYIIYGRTWEEFVSLCEAITDIFELESHLTLICYIHNMGFEFQFMNHYFTWDNVFATDERKPIKALCSLGIEFRDSYILSGMSLEKTADNLVNHTVKKLVGNLDYSLLHTYKTELSEKELAYCENDIVILQYYINEQIQMYDNNISKIPLTNTGKVRRFVGNNCYFTNKNHKKSNSGKYNRYRKLMKKLQLTEQEYYQLKRAFGGGFTHANPQHSGKLLQNVGSHDFTSSYPTVMLAEMFPMSKGFKIHCDTIEDFNNARKMYCLVFDIKFEGLQSKITFENYLSESKCVGLKNKIVNNGRIYSADECITTLTNVDYDIMEQAYQWESMDIRNITAYYKGYLPKDIILSILSLYKDKTQLKGIEGKEVEYLVSKGMLNSIYGMSVTDIIRDENTFTTQWEKEPADVENQIEKYNKGRKRFLFYPWGIFVTAYARRNLWTGILEFKDDYVYSDTDSIKALNVERHKKYIENYNHLIVTKLKKMCEHYSINFNLTKPKNKNGVEKPIGIWDYEGTYERFKTLGAKRYLVEENGQLQLTVAGLSKKNGLNYMIEQSHHDNTKVFEMFNDELYIPAEKTGKMTHTYIDFEKEFTCLDYQGNESHIKVPSGVHLENCDFTLSIAKEYGTFLKNYFNGYIYKGVTSTL